MKVYLLNSAIMVQEGDYHYEKITREKFVELIKQYYQENKLISYIGYEQNAKLIEKWSGIKVDVNRSQVETLEDGDLMLVMKLKYRVANPALKGQEVDENDFDFALVKYKKEV